MLDFDEWLLVVTPEGTTHQDEVWKMFKAIEHLLTDFKKQLDRKELFLAIAKSVYEHSEMFTYGGSRNVY